MLCDARRYAERFFASQQPDTVALGAFQEGCKSNSMVVLFTKLDCRVGRYLLQKQESSAVVFDSLRGAASHWVQEFLKAVPRATAAAFEGRSELGDVVKSFENDDEGDGASSEKKSTPSSKGVNKASAKALSLSPSR